MNTTNTFEEGLRRDLDERRNNGKTLYDSVNGTIVYHDNGSLVWRPSTGNALVLLFDEDTEDPDAKPPGPIGSTIDHMPMGGCSFADCCVIYTVSTVTGATTLWVFQFNKERQSYGQILMSDLNFPPEDKFNGTLLEPVVMRPVFENSELYRCYWCDGVESYSNPLRALSFRVSGTVTDPTYAGVTVVGTFKTYERLAGQSPSGTDIMAPWWPGRIWFKQRIPGQLLSGSYVYVYRQIRSDGYRTPWSMPTNPVFNTTDPVDMQNMHKYEMEAPNQQTAFGVRLIVQGIDERYEKLEVGYVYITDPDVLPTIGVSFAFLDVDTSGSDKRMEVDHRSMNGEPFSPEELDTLMMNIRGAKTIEVKDNRLWVGNYKTSMMSLTDDEVEAVLANFKVHHFMRDMCADEKGKSDYCEDIHQDSRPFTHVTPTTTTLDFWLSDGQFINLPIVDDYRNYKGQQVANLYVGYPRDETVRFGIRFYDLVGQPGFVYHLCDYRFPKIYKGSQTADVSAERIDKDEVVVNVLDDTLFLSGDMRNSWHTTNMGDDLSIGGGVAGALGTDAERPLTYDSHDHALTGQDEYGWPISLVRIMGLLMHGIDVSGIKSKISGYSIVRCPIEHTTISQGLVSPCVLDGDEIRPMPRATWAGVIDSDPASGTYGRLQWMTESGDALWDTESVRDEIFMSYNFLNIYFMDVMFNPELKPQLQSGDSLELVQVLWEEYNNKSQVSYPAGEPIGRRVNLVHAGPTNNRDDGDKLSWHTLCMTREVRPDNSTFPSTMLFSAWDGTHFTNPGNNFPPTDEVVDAASSHPEAAGYNANWAAAEFLFPLYGSVIGFEYIKWVAMNEELAGIDMSNPTWKFLNKVRNFYSNGPGGAGILDPIYGGINDNQALNIGSASIPGGGRWEGIGHDNTALVKYVSIDGPNGEAAKYPLACIFPSYAETTLGGPTTTDGAPRKHSSYVGAVSRWMVNWKRSLGSVYGGQTKTALQNNIFVPIGHFQPVNNPGYVAPAGDVYDRAEIWGGDTYLDFHSAATLLPNYMHDSGASADPASREGADTGCVITFPVESRYNHAMRNAPSPGNPISSSVGLRPWQNYEGYTNRGTGGLFFFGGLNGRAVNASKHYLEEFFINALMRLEARWHVGATKPRGFIELDHFPLRWHYSELKFYGSLVDAFRQFLVNNWNDTDGQYGPVEGSINFNDNVYSFQHRAISTLRINERSLIKDENGNTITTGDGVTLAGYDVLVQTAGTQHRMSIVASSKAIYFVDVDGRAIFAWAGGSGNDLHNIGLDTGNSEIISNVLRHYKDSQTVWVDEKRTGVFTGFDPVREDVYFNLPSRVQNAANSDNSQRYKYVPVTFIAQNTDIYGNSLPSGTTHDYISLSPLDKGTYIIESGVIPHLRDQDIVILENWPSPATRPVYIDILLYRGIFQNSAFTVKEWYLVIRPAHENMPWAINIINRYNPVASLSEPNQDWPSRDEDRTGYRYASPNYTRPFPNKITSRDYGCVLHFYRPEPDGVFQVRLLNGYKGEGDALGSYINPRSVFIYNEKNNVVKGWESVAAHFNLLHAQRLLQARENHSSESAIYERLDHTKDTPKLFGMTYEAWMQMLVNADPSLTKIFDNLQVATAEMSDVKDVRFSTEDQAILLPMSGEQRAAFKRSLLRMPIRTLQQLSRMRGTYLVVDIHINSRRMKIAYVAEVETVYRIDNRS